MVNNNNTNNSNGERKTSHTSLKLQLGIENIVGNTNNTILDCKFTLVNFSVYINVECSKIFPHL